MMVVQKKKKVAAQKEEKMVAQKEKKVAQRLPVAGHGGRAADARGCAWNGAR